ncbi:hypothetical protein H6503_04875 [Candidatus Woesearchaeota archaeon]|nr:hypothetical protein [Candidatus Woesearchaeota archaeon]
MKELFTSKYVSDFPRKEIPVKILLIKTLEERLRDGDPVPSNIGGMPKGDLLVSIAFESEQEILHYSAKSDIQNIMINGVGDSYVITQCNKAVGLVFEMLPNPIMDDIEKAISSYPIMLPEKASISDIEPMSFLSRPYIVEIIDTFIGPAYKPPRKDNFQRKPRTTRAMLFEQGLRANGETGEKPEPAENQPYALNYEERRRAERFEALVEDAHDYDNRSMLRKKSSVPAYIEIEGLTIHGKQVILSQSAINCYRKMKDIREWSESDLCEIEPHIRDALSRSPIEISDQGTIYGNSPYFFNVVLGVIDMIGYDKNMRRVDINLINTLD